MAGRVACVHTRDGRAGRDAMRSARSGRAGKGAGRAVCPAYVCQRGAGVRTRRVRGGRGPRRGEGALRASARLTAPREYPGAAGATHPGPAEGPLLRSGSGSWLLARRSRLPAGLPQRARSGAKPGRRRQRHPCSVARRPPRGSAARTGGSAGPGRRTGAAAPQSGHAPRSPPRAPSRSPATRLPSRSLFNLK